MNIEIKKSIKPINYFNALKLLETRLENLSKNIERELIWTLEHDEIFTAGTSYLENEIIDKSIPYHIIFVLTFDNEVMLSVSQKHLHPTNENNTVLDWTFKSTWFARDEISYKLNLKESLDFVIKDFCIQLSGKDEDSDLSLNEIVEKETQIEKLEKEINTLRSQIKRSKQFNRKVELNSILKEKEGELARINLNN